MSKRFNINSIYLGTEGEGINIGVPQVFVRFQGCSLRCLNCDSKYSWKFESCSDLSLEQVYNEIYETSNLGKIRRVSITGGDPLDKKNVEQVINLVKKLKHDGYFISIEASGNVVDHRVFDLVDFISMDIKMPSSGVETASSNILALIEQYKGKFQIKSVIKDELDFEYCLKKYQAIASKDLIGTLKWCLTPSYETAEEFPQERFQNIIEWNHQANGVFRVIGQQHKWIYGPSRKDV